jgi:hypothetical protein
MIALLPLFLGVTALAAAVVLMVHKTRASGREGPAPGADDPLFFVRYRPSVIEVEPPEPVPAARDKTPATENH